MINHDQKKDNSSDETISIYQRREEKSEKQKLREMTFKEKITYFNNYYRTKTIAVLIATVLVIYFIYSIATPDAKTVLYAAVINSAMDDVTALNLQEDFAKHLTINTKKESIFIDTSFNIGGENNMSEYAQASQQKLSTYLFASQLDIIIAPESCFKQFAHAGSLSILSDVLPTDLCSSLADSFYYSDTNEDKTSSPYGIYLDNTALYKKYGQLVDKPVLGIVVNSKYTQNGVEFVRYLFDLYN